MNIRLEEVIIFLAKYVKGTVVNTGDFFSPLMKQNKKYQISSLMATLLSAKKVAASRSKSNPSINLLKPTG